MQVNGPSFSTSAEHQNAHGCKAGKLWRKLGSMAENGRIRVATFNIRHGAPAEKKENRGDPKQTALACASLEADILALQEVDRHVMRSGWKDMAALAAKESGMEVVYRRAMRYYAGSRGNALLVRGEIEDDWEELPLGGGPRVALPILGKQLILKRELRNAILATVYIKGRRISVAATHLATQRRISQNQLPEIVDALAARHPGDPQIVLGDMNRNREEIMKYSPLPDSMALVDGPPTYPAGNPRQSIDHIAVSGLTICGVETRQLAVSDHRALIAEVE